MEIATLSQIVSQHARSLCRELLPEGVVEGNNFRIGDVYGEKGKSMSIRLDGENAGEWKDFESGDGLEVGVSAETGCYVFFLRLLNLLLSRDNNLWSKTC